MYCFVARPPRGVVVAKRADATSQREPLSKALRGRPFDHEEFMEILFPDVIGSGGAPKRIMKRRKGPDGTSIAAEGAEHPGQAIMDLTVDPSLYQTPTHNAAHNPAQQASQPIQIPPPSTSQPLQHPTAAGIPPRAAAASTSALTPPDETPNPASSRKRHAPDSAPQSEKRRRPSRFPPNIYNSTPPTATPNTSLTFAPTTSSAAPPPRAQPLHSAFNTPALPEDWLHTLADALRSRSTPKWPEQAVEILFRDFSEEDPDLQLKIAEKALTDENKAMVFVKSTPELRRHWVRRLREVHLRGLGLGRVGEEAS
jgi:hypothetical protein